LAKQHNKRPPDFYALSAKREGYAARSVYKLAEIDTRHRLLRSGGRVLDVGAAPGSWTCYAQERLGPQGLVVSVDINPIARTSRDGAPVQLFQMDITDESAWGPIIELGPYDSVLSDAAPSTTGNRTVDTGRSEALVESVVALAEKSLRPGGALVTKVFQGGWEVALRERLRARFTAVRLVRPRATRDASMEAFLVATGFAGRRQSADT
jgi:23S rRNA (uridine2552-2'-O)-methyltransferase